MSEERGFAAWWAEYQRVNKAGAAQMYTAQAAWDKALEAAAQVCDKRAEVWRWGSEGENEARGCADAIRSLQSRA